MHSGKSTKRLHDLQRLLHQRRLGLVGVHGGNTRIDIENMGARSHLRQGIPDHRFKIAGLHLGSQLLAPRGIDALADHREGPVKANDVLARGGCNESVGHDESLPPLAIRVLSRSLS